MKMLTSVEIRNIWLNFFKERGHMIEPGASLVPHNDPTLLWINSGVAALKKYFDGSEIPASRRITNVQKSIRTNDIENVGKTARHHTFFEMLGNFSIGDYFRNEVIPWAYEILTNEKYFGLDKDKIYVTYNPIDEDTKKLWIKCGLPESHLISLETNYWQIGEGPCGPNTEVFFDRGEKYDPENLGIKLLTDEIENDRYIEIWGIVFSQYNAVNGVDRKDYKELPSKNIDTGAGLERICCIIQGTETNFETDLFMPIIKEAEKYSEVKYENNKTAYRVISDHIRSCVFALADGAIFSNEGRGYVLRRLLRRAMRYGRKIGFNKPFLYNLVDITIKNMQDFYPYLITKKEKLEKTILDEENKFLRTLNSGEDVLNEMIKKNGKLTGADAFKLYDTFGFPFELTEEIALENGLSINKEEFDNLMKEQKERARASRVVIESMNKQSKDLLDCVVESKFDYNSTKLESKAVALFKDGVKVNSISDEGYVMFENTPLYAEMGGQVSDIGTVSNSNFSANVEGVSIAPNKQNLHKISVNAGKLKVGDIVTLEVDEIRRHNIEANHSATHLLHKALKIVLGGEVTQKGSFVCEDYLRFDFNYNTKLTANQLNEIENIVNEFINNSIKEETLVLPIEEAVKTGAEHEFNEKYGDFVRVVTFGETSKEFCGGTHVKNTRDIGIFMITSEESISAGVRRIEATTGFAAYKNIKALQEKYNKINSIIGSKSVTETIDKVNTTLNEKANLIAKNNELTSKLSVLEANEIIKNSAELKDFSILVEYLKDASREMMVSILDIVKQKMNGKYLIVFIGQEANGSYPIVISGSKDNGQNGNLILRGLNEKFTTSGGGRPDFVNGIIKSNDKVAILEEIKKLVKQ